MDEYTVHFSGSVGVEAESAEEAKQKARETVSHPSQGEIHGFEAENLHDRPQQFQAKLVRTGSSYQNSTTQMMTGKSALMLSLRTVNQVLRSMVGKEDVPQLKYDLAALLFAELEGEDVAAEPIWEHIQKMQERANEEGAEWMESNLWTLADDSDADE